MTKQKNQTTRTFKDTSWIHIRWGKHIHASFKLLQSFKNVGYDREGGWGINMNTIITSHLKCASCSRWREENKTHSMPDIKNKWWRPSGQWLWSTM